MKRLSRRSIIRLGAAATAAFAVHAPTQPASAQGKTTIDVVHPWSGDNGGARSMDALAQRFREARPDVDIRHIVAPGGDYERTQVAAFAAGNVPDVSLVFAERLPSYADRGALTALEDRAARGGVKMADYFAVVAAQTTWAGQLYGMTHHPDLRAVLYRSEPRLRAAGLDPDAPPESWVALRDAAERTVQMDGSRLAAAGWIPAWSDVPWALLLALANGATPLDASGAQAAFDDPRVVEAIAFGLAATEAGGRGFDTVADFAARQPGPGQETGLVTGSLAHAVGGSWYLDRLAAKDGEPARRTRVGLLPGGPSSPWRRISVAGGVVQTIPTGARAADAAWSYLSWVAGPEGQRVIQSVSYDMAGLRAAARDPDAIATHLHRAEMVDWLEQTHASAHLPTPSWPMIRDELERVQQLVLQKQLGPAAAAAQLQHRAQSLLDAHRAVGRPLFASPPAAPAPGGTVSATGNLLRNPSFEAGGYRAGLSSSVASDWSRWFQHRGAEGPGYHLPEPEYGILVGRAGQSRSGVKAMRWFNSWAVHNGGVYQTVDVPAGAWLRFTAHMLGWSSQSDEFAKSGGIHFRQVGVDPDGGTDPFDPRIVWSAADETMDRWTAVSVTAQARGGRVSVFVRSHADWALKHNDSLLDDSELVVLAPPDDAAALLAAPLVEPVAVDPSAVGTAALFRDRVSGSLGGRAAGAHAYYAFDYPGGEALRRIVARTAPTDPAALARFGFRVYGPRRDDLYVMSIMRPGEASGVLPYGEPGRYLIDLYNYNPGGQVDYQLSLLTK